MRDLVIQNLIKNLNEAHKNAVASNMDFHFLSELDHLIATAKANLEHPDDLKK